MCDLTITQSSLNLHTKIYLKLEYRESDDDEWEEITVDDENFDEMSCVSFPSIAIMSVQDAIKVFKIIFDGIWSDCQEFCDTEPHHGHRTSSW